ncbi:hypothetical protein NDU88_004579 [Pleurodeles waltl]|uniref:Uncharacterized protein n=1 Tax=Pleurodeles waltl TaxID=8319 RepID=A0AAV7SJB3_PLEWA|nr:hypothetical protein NDU88_004579 [Pleurodeles waltl]
MPPGSEHQLRRPPNCYNPHAGTSRSSWPKPVAVAHPYSSLGWGHCPASEVPATAVGRCTPPVLSQRLQMPMLLCRGAGVQGWGGARQLWRETWRETLGLKDAQRVEPPTSAYRRRHCVPRLTGGNEVLHRNTVPLVGCRPRGAVAQPTDAVATAAVPSHLQVHC